MAYREAAGRGRERGSVRRQPRGGAKRQRQDAALNGRRLHGRGRRMKYWKEGGKRELKGRADMEDKPCCTDREGYGVREEGAKKERAAEEMNLPPLTLVGTASTGPKAGGTEPGGGEVRVGRRNRRRMPGAGCRMPCAGRRAPCAGRRRQRARPKVGAGNRSRGPESGPKRRFGYASRRCLSIPAAKGRRTPAESIRPASRMPPFESK